MHVAGVVDIGGAVDIAERRVSQIIDFNLMDGKMLLDRRKFGALVGGAASLLAAPSVVRAQNLETVRLCWTGSLCVGGHALQVLRKTDIAARNGIKLEMKQFLPGPSITEALISGAGDIGSTSDFSAVTMMAAGAPLKTISIDCNFRTAVLATKASGIKTMAELKGKSIYGLFGITAYMNAQQAVAAAGLKLTDVKFVNIALAELMDAVRAQKIEAFFLWDPWVALSENNGLAVSLSNNVTPAQVYFAREKFVQERPAAVKGFLRAYAEAMYFVSQNHELTTEWFRAVEPGRQIPEDVVAAASKYDPRWSARRPADIKLAIDGNALASMEEMARWGFSEKLLARNVAVTNGIDMTAANAVEAELKDKTFDLSAVKITG